MELIKWQLNFGSCNFGLKSYLWFQIVEITRMISDQSSITIIKYVASSSSGKDEPNTALWLANLIDKMDKMPCDWLCERARWPYLARSGLRAVSLKKRASRNQVLYWPSLFGEDGWLLARLRFYRPRRTPFWSMTTRKRTRPISTHLDLTLVNTSRSQDCSVTHISIALRVQIRLFSSSALNFIKTVRTSRQLPRTRPVDCGTCSQETVSDFSQDTRYLNNNNKHHMQWILCFITKTWHRCRKVII